MGKLGAVICWENYMPMLRMAMYAKGIQLYCAPTADDRETWISTMRHVALEGRCFVLSACQFTRRSDYPADYPIEGNPSPDAIIMRGGSCIIGPLGQVLAERAYDVETILTATLDPGDIARGKFDFDVAGHYARPDVFRFRSTKACSRPCTTNAPPVVTGRLMAAGSIATTATGSAMPASVQDADRRHGAVHSPGAIAAVQASAAISAGTCSAFGQPLQSRGAVHGIADGCVLEAALRCRSRRTRPCRT